MKTHRSTSTGARRPSASEKERLTENEPCTPDSCGREKIPPEWVWHYRTLMHLRERLRQAHADHASQAAMPPDTESNDIADMAQEQSHRDLLWAELGSEKDKLFEIDCALQRIRDGVYGSCEVTGHVIPPDRLRAVPWTRYCRNAAEGREKDSATQSGTHRG